MLGQEDSSAITGKLVKACAEIVKELVVAVKSNKDINLNALKSRVSRKFKLSNQPKLVDIIAAIPEQHKELLLPRLKAKPVRTASGVCFSSTVLVII